MRVTAPLTVELPDHTQEMEVPLEDLGNVIVLTGLKCLPWMVWEGVHTLSTGRQGRGKV